MLDHLVKARSLALALNVGPDYMKPWETAIGVLPSVTVETPSCDWGEVPTVPKAPRADAYGAWQNRYAAL